MGRDGALSQTSRIKIVNHTECRLPWSCGRLPKGPRGFASN
jgi:hypothetical protein